MTIKIVDSKLIVLLTISLSCLLLLFGCTSPENPEPSQTPAPGSPLVEIPTGTMQPKATANVVTPAKATIATTLVPATATAEMPTQTPLPTLSDDQSAALIEAILTEDHLCELPCFAGFTPGLSLTRDAEAFFETFAQEIYHPSNHPHRFLAYLSPPRLLSESESVIVRFYGRLDGFIDLIEAFRYQYSISELFSTYGMPGEIYLFVGDTLPVHPYGTFELLFHYSDLGIMAGFEGRMNKGDILEICPSNLSPGLEGPFLWLWSPDQEKTLEMLEADYFSGLEDLEFYHPIFEMAGFGVEEFFDIYADPGNQDQCFEVSNPYPPE